MRTLARLASMAVLASTTFTLAASASVEHIQHRLNDATQILHELNKIPDDDIPNGIAQKARCVIVVPSFKKGAFIVGAEYGQGVATCYVANKGWSAPVFVRMSGASFGLQIGGQGTDLVLVGVSAESGQKLLHEKIKLGGDVSVAAGPVGRNSKAETGILANAGFLTYSRNKGLFAGIDLNGDEVNQNGDDTREYYGHDYKYESILNGAIRTPAGAKAFIREIRRVFGGGAR